MVRGDRDELAHEVNGSRRGQLLLSPKERAEHIMLVDLARNDVGRVAELGSVKIGDLLRELNRAGQTLVLVTHNTTEFKRVPRLRIDNWQT